MKEVTILGHRIAIKPISSDGLAKVAKNDGLEGEYRGFFDPEDEVIYVWSGAEGEFYKRILIHEIIHAYFKIAGLDNILGDEHEEATCSLLENLLPLFKDKKFIEEMNA